MVVRLKPYDSCLAYDSCAALASLYHTMYKNNPERLTPSTHMLPYILTPKLAKQKKAMTSTTTRFKSMGMAEVRVLSSFMTPFMVLSNR